MRLDKFYMLSKLYNLITYHVCLDCRLNSHLSVRIGLEARIQDTVRYLIAQFVWVAFAD